jgi:hypothetical protein
MDPYSLKSWILILLHRAPQKKEKERKDERKK